MQESRYFYDGIPLVEYCRDNDINVNAVRTRIWKLMHNKKYSEYSEQEIVDLVINGYGNAVKYMYHGVSLRQYCLDNGLNFGTIYSRINKLKKQDSTLSNEQLVVFAVEEFENQNYRYYYDGMPLVEYCRLHPSISYSAIKSYLNTEQAKNPQVSDDELIRRYMEKEHRGMYRLYYLGIPLKRYCMENGLSYKNIITYMSKYRKDKRFMDLSDDEFVEAVMNFYQPFEVKYSYDGVTLKEYCRRNNLSYYSVVSFVKRKISCGSSKSVDELIDEGIKTINRYGIIYYYNGLPLVEYAKDNNLNYSSIRCNIFRKKAKSDKPLQEIVDECCKSYQKFSIKYYYDGVPLREFCNRIGLNYYTVIHKYLFDYSDDTSISVDDAIKRIVDDYLVNPPVRTKYFFNNQSLTKFCDKNGYPYLAILRRIKTLQSKDLELSRDNIVEEAIKKYEDRLEIDKINHIFIKLRSSENLSEDEIIDICSKLKVDYENVVDLVNMGFSYNQAVNMIWYFSDRKSSTGRKIISDLKLEELFELTEKVKNSLDDVEEFELYDLIGIYKSGLYDSRNAIVLRQKKYLSHVMYSICRSYDIDINASNIDDFESELKYYLLLVVDRTNLNVYGQIVKYMDLTVKGYFKTYLKSYSRGRNNVSLDQSMYDDNGSDKERKMAEFIADPNSVLTDVENTSFSSTMMRVLSNLSHDNLSFIMLKYQENYSNEELAQFYDISLDEVVDKEEKILGLLRNSDKAKALRKTVKE